MRVRFTPRARQDLAEIGDWIAADNPKAAARMVDRLISAGEGLSRLPLRFPAANHRALRKRVVGDYILFYRVLDTVENIRILHSARDWLSLLEEA